MEVDDNLYDQYAVSNGSGYAVLIGWDEYAVLDRELDTPYPVEVDTPYSTVDQSSARIRRIFLDGYGTPPIVSTSPIVTPTVEKTNDGFQTVGKKKKRKGKSKSNNGGQFAGPSVKQSVRYEPKATTNTPKKGATNKGNESIPSSLLKNWGNSLNKDNISSSNSFSALNVEED
ncbi:hypothetical protein Tco_0691519 [Tanacetum coccineum]